MHCFFRQVNVSKEHNHTTFTDVEQGNVLLTVRYFFSFWESLCYQFGKESNLIYEVLCKLKY